MMQTLLSQIGQINLTNLPDQLLTNFAYKLAIFCDKFFPFLYLSLCAKPCLLRIYSFQSLLLSRGLCPINKRESILSFMQACPREYSLLYLHGFSLTLSSEVLIFSITSYYNRQITIYFLLLVQLTSWTITSSSSQN